MTRLHVLCGVLTAVILSGCTVHPIRPPAVVEPPVAREACAAYCEQMIKMQCGPTATSGVDGIDGTADDVSCERACQDIVLEGFPPSRPCLDTARSCNELDACMLGPEVAPEMSNGPPPHPHAPAGAARWYPPRWGKKWRDPRRAG